MDGDSDDLHVSILHQKFQSLNKEVIRAVLEENDNRLAAAEEALRTMVARQGGSGTGPSGRPVRYDALQEISPRPRAIYGWAGLVNYAVALVACLAVLPDVAYRSLPHGGCAHRDDEYH